MLNIYISNKNYSSKHAASTQQITSINLSILQNSDAISFNFCKLMLIHYYEIRHIFNIDRIFLHIKKPLLAMTIG